MVQRLGNVINVANLDIFVEIVLHRKFLRLRRRPSRIKLVRCLKMLSLVGFLRFVKCELRGLLDLEVKVYLLTVGLNYMCVLHIFMKNILWYEVLENLCRSLESRCIITASDM